MCILPPWYILLRITPGPLQPSLKPSTLSEVSLSLPMKLSSDSIAAALVLALVPQVIAAPTLPTGLAKRHLWDDLEAQFGSFFDFSSHTSSTLSSSSTSSKSHGAGTPSSSRSSASTLLSSNGINAQVSRSKASTTHRSSSTFGSSPASTSTANSQNGSWLGDLIPGFGGGGSHGSHNHSSGSESGGKNHDSSMLLNGKFKIGLSWANGDSAAIGPYIKQKVSWYYSWDDTPNLKNPPTNITFCPMLWGYKNVKSFKRNVLRNWNDTLNQGKCVLGMNEPNQKGQSDMLPVQACQLMRENVIPLKKHGYYIVSPVTTNAPSGRRWMDKFRRICPDVWSSIDAAAVHFYDTDTDKFKKYVSHWHNRYNKPIWVTEYACQDFNGGQQCSDTDAHGFHTEMASWFDNQDFVEAYAPFGVMRDLQGVAQSNSLMSEGSPNSLFSDIVSDN